MDSQSVKTTGVGGEARGYDGGKKVKERKRHLLVDTEGFVLKATVMSAKVMDYEGFKELLDRGKWLFPRLSHLWLDAGYSGEDKGGDWVEKWLGWTVEIVRRARKPAPEEVLMAWAQQWAKEGVAVDWQELLPPRGFQVLPLPAGLAAIIIGTRLTADESAAPGKSRCSRRMGGKFESLRSGKKRIVVDRAPLLPPPSG